MGTGMGFVGAVDSGDYSDLWLLFGAGVFGLADFC
jgi:hypothetical protein